MFSVDRVAEKISATLGLCGHGKDNNWSVKIADFFFIDCGCCWFWRGAVFGAFVGIVTVVMLAEIVTLIRGL